MVHHQHLQFSTRTFYPLLQTFTTLNMMPSTVTRTQLLMVVLILSLFTPAQSFGTCRSSFRCFNGGEERYGQSIFGPCRCKCRPGYTGPRCQYREVTRKRSSSLNILQDFLQARLRAEREREQRQRQLLQLQRQEEAFLSADRDTDTVLDGRRRRRRSRSRSAMNRSGNMSGLGLRGLFIRR